MLPILHKRNFQVSFTMNLKVIKHSDNTGSNCYAGRCIRNSLLVFHFTALMHYMYFMYAFMQCFNQMEFYSKLWIKWNLILPAVSGYEEWISKRAWIHFPIILLCMMCGQWGMPHTSRNSKPPLVSNLLWPFLCISL